MKVLEAKNDDGGVVVAAIPADLALEYWENVEEYAARALEHAYDGMTVETVLERIVDGRLILVVITVGGVIKASMTIEICQIPMGKIAHCMTLSGDDLESWVDEYIEIWTKLGEALGCEYITIKGRAGWEKYARRYGFKHMYTNMALKIGEQN